MVSPLCRINVRTNCVAQVHEYIFIVCIADMHRVPCAQLFDSEDCPVRKTSRRAMRRFVAVALDRRSDLYGVEVKLTVIQRADERQSCQNLW